MHQSLLCEKLSDSNEEILLSADVVVEIGIAIELCNLTGNMETLPSSNVLLTLSD